MSIYTLVRQYPREVALEAVYFVVREVKQSSLASESQKEHLVDADDSPPSEEALRLIRRIVAEATDEGAKPFASMNGDDRGSLIDTLFGVIEELNREAPEIDAQLGKKALDALRSPEKAERWAKSTGSGL